MALAIGDTIDGKYEIVRLLGEGGMGAVYEGINTRIHRRVAIKVLHSGVAGNEEAMKRFEREAQAAGRIGSEHIVEVLDLGDLPAGERYMVMEFLEGEPLSARMAKGRMAPRDIAKIVVDMLEGLEAAHRANIVHRDLKPDNVFILAKGDFTKIVDFGISKFNAMGGEFSMTRTGAVMGTPYYMAPEQAKGGKDIDHRVDVYAVGVILYQAVVGSVPFDAGTFNELLFKIVLEPPPRILDIVPQVDPMFAGIVERAMAREVADRYQSASELKSELAAWLGGTFVAAGRTVSAGTPLMTDHGQADGPVGVSQTTVGGVTPGFANDVQDELGEATVPVRKSPIMMIAAIVGAAIVVGGLVFTLTGEDQSTPPEETIPKSEPSEERARSEAQHKQALAALEEERKRAEEARAAAERAQLEAKRNEIELENAEKARAEKERTDAQKVPPTVSPRPILRPRPAPVAAPPAPSPKPAPAPAPSTVGRPIRTDL